MGQETDHTIRPVTPVVDIDWPTTVMITAPVSCTSLGFDCVLASARPIAVYRGCRLHEKQADAEGVDRQAPGKFRHPLD